jgi:hypothetical protein
MKSLAILFLVGLLTISASPPPKPAVFKRAIELTPHTPYPYPAPKIVGIDIGDCGVAGGASGICADVNLQANLSGWCTQCNIDDEIPLTWIDQSGRVFYAGMTGFLGQGNQGVASAWVGALKHGGAGSGGPHIPSEFSCIRIALGDNQSGQFSDYSNQYCLTKIAAPKAFTLNVSSSGKIRRSRLIRL